MLTKRTSIEEIKRLLQDNNQSETAKILNVPNNTLSRWIKKYSIDYPKKLPDKFSLPTILTKEQNDLICGHLLGDGSIAFAEGKYSRFIFAQKIINKDYVLDTYNTLKPFTEGIAISILSKKVIYKGKESIFLSSKFATRTHPIFSKLREDWYEQPNVIYSPKNIPHNFTLNEKILAYWYMDDGYNDSRGYCELATQSFSYKNNEQLKKLLYNQFNIVALIKKCRNNKFFLKINKRSYQNFIQIVKPYIHRCFNYKVLLKGNI